MLVVADDGIGIPEGLDFQRSDSLGMELVRTLTQQLHGSVELDRTGGTRFEIVFAGTQTADAAAKPRQQSQNN